MDTSNLISLRCTRKEMVSNTPLGLFLFTLMTTTLVLTIFSTVRVTRHVNVSLATDIYQNLAAGFLKSSQPGEPFYTASKVVLPIDVDDILDPIHGGLGVSSMPPGLVSSRWDGSYGSAAVNMTNETVGLLATTRGALGVNGPYINGQLLVGNETAGGILSPAQMTPGMGISIANLMGGVKISGQLEWHVISDTKAAGTPGGQATDGTNYFARTLNTVVSSPNATSLISLSGNAFRLAAGRYLIDAWSMIYNATTAYTGRTALTLNPSGAIRWGVSVKGLAGEVRFMRLFHIFNVLTPTSYLIKARVNKFGSTSDYGPAGNDGSPEYYSRVFLLKIV